MTLTREFKNTVMKRLKNDPKYGNELLQDAVNELLNGNIDISKAILRDYINATISFEQLSKDININSKSIQRMLSASGNPTTKSLILILNALQSYQNVHFDVFVKRNKAA